MNPADRLPELIAFVRGVIDRNGIGIDEVEVGLVEGSVIVLRLVGPQRNENGILEFELRPEWLSDTQCPPCLSHDLDQRLFVITDDSATVLAATVLRVELEHLVFRDNREFLLCRRCGYQETCPDLELL